MSRVPRAQIVAAAALAVSGICGTAAHAQLLFSTEADWNAWTPPGGAQPDIIMGGNGNGSGYNGLASGATAGPGAAGVLGSLPVTIPAGSNGFFVTLPTSQNFLNNLDAMHALAGADYIQVDFTLPADNSGLTSGSFFELDLYIQTGGVQDFNPLDSPVSVVNNGSYWTATYPDVISLQTIDFINFGFLLNTNYNNNAPITANVANIRVVPPAWNNASGGDWNTFANWNTADSGLSPNYQGLEADFLGAITSNQTVSTSTTVNIGTILFNNTSASYTLAATGSGNITMNMPGVEPAAINDQGGTHFISAPLILASSTNVTVANPGDVLHLSGQISGAGGLTVAGNGTVSLESANSYAGATAVTSGTLSVAAAGALPATTSLTIGTNTTTAEVQLASSTGDQSVAALTINPGSVLDLTNNRLIVNYGTGPDPASIIRSYLINGYNGGTWTGTTGGAINSSTAAAPANNASFAIGYADGADNVVTGLSSGQIELQYTLYGDANLDGVVNGDDFTILASNLGKQVSAWDQGDFNYDGVVGGDDFTLLVENLGKQTNGADVSLPASDYAALDAFAAANGLMADVPEPSPALFAISLAMTGLFLRRRSTSTR